MKTPCLVVKVSWFRSSLSLNHHGGIILDLVPNDRTLLSLVRIARGNVVMDSVSSSRFLEPSFETMYIIVCEREEPCSLSWHDFFVPKKSEKYPNIPEH